MQPILFSLRLGSAVVHFPAYGAFVGLGFALGIARFVRAGRRRGLDAGRLQDLAFSSVVFGLAGSRLAFVLVNVRAFVGACWPPPKAGAFPADHWLQGGCWAPLRFWDGGLVFYGGAAAVGGVFWFFCRRDGWSFLRLGDLAAPSVALGHAVGRIGCFMAGCCYGKTCAAPWAVRFGPGSVAFDEGLAAGGRLSATRRSLTAPLHPTQLYEALGELSIFVILILVERHWARAGAGRSTPDLTTTPARAATPAPAAGRLLGVYLLAYAGLRFGVELFRGDISRGYLFRWEPPALDRALGLGAGTPILLSTSQALSLLLGACVALAFAWAHFRERHPRAGEP